jgi:hypothetical protein
VLCLFVCLFIPHSFVSRDPKIYRKLFAIIELVLKLKLWRHLHLFEVGCVSPLNNNNNNNPKGHGLALAQGQIFWRENTNTNNTTNNKLLYWIELISNL